MRIKFLVILLVLLQGCNATIKRNNFIYVNENITSVNEENNKVGVEKENNKVGVEKENNKASVEKENNKASKGEEGGNKGVFDGLSAQLNPGIFFNFYGSENYNIDRATVRNGKIFVNKKREALIRIGLEGHISFPLYSVYKEKLYIVPNNSSFLQVTEQNLAFTHGLGMFVAIAPANVSEILSWGGFGVLYSFIKYDDEGRARSYFNFGIGLSISNDYKKLPLEEDIRKSDTGELIYPEGSDVELVEGTKYGCVIMFSFNPGF